MNTRELDVIIGKNLRVMRHERRMSLRQVGEQISPPCTSQQIQKYEAAINSIKAGQLFQIARLFNVSIRHFFYGVDAGDIASILNSRPKGE